MRLSFGCVLAGLLGLARSGELDADLKRARTWKPRSGFRGAGSLASANRQLNRHLEARSGHRFKACEEFSVADLREVLRSLLPLGSEALKQVYSPVDGRRATYDTIAEMEAHWASSAPATDERVRDAHCHEAVMWFVHHLTTEAQHKLALQTMLPKLPIADHSKGQGHREPEDAAGRFYESKITCQNCHVGGIDNLGLHEVKPETDLAKARRCYTNYKELYNITCGPCDGIAGKYWGDSDKDFAPTDCLVVAQPHEVPEAERVKVAVPHQFSVDVVGGSDRFGRSTATVNDTLGWMAKIYGQIHGKWYMDAKPGADMWMLRHDTVYAQVTHDGTSIPLIAPHVSEIHVQSAKQRSMNLTGPMVSLISGMPDWIPGGCTCIADPVGVPDISAAVATGLANMEYMGRIRLPKLEYLDVPIELDHYANWFFHIFMDTNRSVPHYGKAPSRLASAYAGTAVYANWVMEDPKTRDPDVWHRGIPLHPERVGPDHGKFCMNPKKVDFCNDISQSTFPPTAGSGALRGPELLVHLPFFPGQHALSEVAARLAAAGGETPLVV